MSAPPLPVVIIGAGPVGLAAAAHLSARSRTAVVFEAEASTGRELVGRYFRSLAGTPELPPHVRFENRVVAVSRLDHDLMQDGGRDTAPYVVRVSGPTGEYDVLAEAVIDTSGTARATASPFLTPRPQGSARPRMSAGLG
jgi:phytoene dehydrogenase-like protein